MNVLLKNPKQHVDPVAFPCLAKAMDQKADNGLGMCFYRAAALVLDLQGAEMVFGTIGLPDDRFIHAWVEFTDASGDWVVAPTMFENAGFGRVARAIYYQTNEVSDVSRLPRRTLKKIAGEIGFLRWLNGEIVMGIPAELMAAAGVRWKTSPQGGVIPA